VIVDFISGSDTLVFEGGVAVTGSRTADANRDGVLDTILSLANSTGSVTLLGVADYMPASMAEQQLTPLEHIA
jgi:hypothetical protein